jgi:hypothetical protein
MKVETYDFRHLSLNYDPDNQFVNRYSNSIIGIVPFIKNPGIVEIRTYKSIIFKKQHCRFIIICLTINYIELIILGSHI